MSKVSGIVLTCSICEERIEDDVIPPKVDSLNCWLAENCSGARLEDVTDHAGGNKHPQVLIYAGGFNYLQEDDFVAEVFSSGWQYPASVALIVNPEEGPVRVFSGTGNSA